VIAARNALLPLASRVDERVLPRAVFTAPEVARVGLTEAEARAADTDVRVVRARFADVDRALTDGDEAGFAKLVSARGRLVGAHIVGARAGELIHVCALAMKRKLDVSALATMSWVYPTLSEVLRKASQSRYQQLLDGRLTKTALGVLRKLKGS
jgi:pyruvate/2-oxoglutarate dehydrogenase complex dihydrolipoamide dehydrogenase (E3) component